MIRFLLDTNICIYVIRNKPRRVVERLRRTRLSGVGISAVTVGELEYGAARSARPEHNRIALLEFLTPLEVAPFDAAAAHEYGDVRAALERAGTPIGALDTLIASHARALGCVLVTNDAAAFSRVSGLRAENWAR